MIPPYLLLMILICVLRLALFGVRYVCMFFVNLFRSIDALLFLTNNQLNFLFVRLQLHVRTKIKEGQKNAGDLRDQ